MNYKFISHQCCTLLWFDYCKNKFLPENSPVFEFFLQKKNLANFELLIVIKGDFSVYDMLIGFRTEDEIKPFVNFGLSQPWRSKKKK